MKYLTAIRLMAIRLLAIIRDNVPVGTALPEEIWNRRHRFLLMLLCVHAFGIPAFAIWQGYSVVQCFWIWSSLAMCALVAGLIPGRRFIPVGDRLREPSTQYRGRLLAASYLQPLRGLVPSLDVGDDRCRSRLRPFVRRSPVCFQTLIWGEKRSRFSKDAHRYSLFRSVCYIYGPGAVRWR